MHLSVSSSFPWFGFCREPRNADCRFHPNAKTETPWPRCRRADARTPRCDACGSDTAPRSSLQHHPSPACGPGTTRLLVSGSRDVALAMVAQPARAPGFSLRLGPGVPQAQLSRSVASPRQLEQSADIHAATRLTKRFHVLQWTVRFKLGHKLLLVARHQVGSCSSAKGFQKHFSV